MGHPVGVLIVGREVSCIMGIKKDLSLLLYMVNPDNSKLRNNHGNAPYRDYYVISHVTDDVISDVTS